ncbi:DUF551 domain-containing protein [Salmonella enterica subsp. salamae]|nr:DUF551 domain-containing protein [Salmonella enterica subsp. salamae]
MTITREQQKQILIDTANHVISRDNTSPYSENLRELARIALASLESEPVAYIFKHPAGELFWSLTDESNKGQNDVMPVYAAPPAPVVPEDLRRSFEAVARLNNEMYRWTSCMSYNGSYVGEPEGLLKRNIREIEHIMDSCRAAMLQGAEPVSQTYELPQTQFEQVADLYEMQFDDGRTCAFHTDGAKAAQWLLACDGNKVQEYVRLERYHEALIGNSPVIPGGWISCSERMPEDEQEVIVHNKLGYRYVSYFDEHSGLFFDMRGGNQMNCIEHLLVTHWRPMPAPPQQ